MVLNDRVSFCSLVKNMSKLYVGNLPSECNEIGLRQLFHEHNLSCTTILVKRGGYAFVDCADQSTADRAIDKLNGEPTTLPPTRHTLFSPPTHIFSSAPLAIHHKLSQIIFSFLLTFRNFQSLFIPNSKSHQSNRQIFFIFFPPLLFNHIFSSVLLLKEKI